MARFRTLAWVLLAALLTSIGTAGAQVPRRAAEPLTQVFTDPSLGFTVKYPATWKPQPLETALGPAVRLALASPRRGRLMVTIYPLPSRVQRYSGTTFERVAHDHVDTVVSIYKTLLKFKTILREQPEDHSTGDAMIFWQGTSALDASQKDWALVTQHVIPYGSDVMVNLIYVGSKDTSGDGAAMDAIMNSVAFPKR
jgi:hypothetical protein